MTFTFLHSQFYQYENIDKIQLVDTITKLVDKTYILGKTAK